MCTSTFLSSPVPSQPPRFVVGHNTSSKSIHVEWQVVPLEFIHGIPLGQKIFYTIVGEASSAQYEAVSPTVVSLNLVGLRKYANYCIQALAYTRIGDGSRSECFFVYTDEDSTYKIKRKKTSRGIVKILN